MASDTADDFLYAPVDETQRRIRTEFTRRLLELYPDAASHIRQASFEEGFRKGFVLVLAVQLAQRLGRALTDAERVVLGERVRTLGVEQVDRAVRDLDADALVAWMRGSDGT